MSKIFPKPLPPLVSVNVPDETGFTALEKCALKNSWRIIRRYRQKHGTNIFLDFYTENEDLINEFRTPSGKISLHELFLHPHVLLHVYDYLIEEGLDDFPIFSMILTDVFAMHKNMKDKTHMRKNIQTCQEYFQGVLKGISSPTINSAFQKLNDIMNSYLTS